MSFTRQKLFFAYNNQFLETKFGIINNMSAVKIAELVLKTGKHPNYVAQCASNRETRIEPGSYDLGSILVSTANTFLTICRVRICAL